MVQDRNMVGGDIFDTHRNLSVVNNAIYLVNFLTVNLLNQKCLSFQKCENRKQQQQFRTQLIYHNQNVKLYIDLGMELGKKSIKIYKAKNE